MKSIWLQTVLKRITPGKTNSIHSSPFFKNSETFEGRNFGTSLNVMVLESGEKRRKLTESPESLKPVKPESLKPVKPYTIVVEGNIGSGKTSFLENFSGNCDIEVLEEPVEKWRNCNGHNLLDLMYQDPSRYSLLFQTYVQLTMLQQHTKKSDKPIRIMERSLLSARYCFVENLYSKGLMSDPEYSVISEWFNFLVSSPEFDFKPDLVVYLRTEPEIAFRRVLARSRKEENKIPFDYLKDLHELHEDWLVKKTKFQPILAPVMIIEANEDLSALIPKYIDCMSRIVMDAKKSLEENKMR